MTDVALVPECGVFERRDEVAQADRIVLLMRGKVTCEGTPDQLMAQSGTSDLTSAYVALTGARAV